MPHHTRRTGSAQAAIGIQVIGEGYVLRADGVAVALIDLTPPDLRLHDADSLARLLDAYTHVLRACPDRCSLLTMAVPLDITPLIHTLEAAQRRAPDFRSYSVLGALADSLSQTWAALAHLRAVRWVVAVPSLAPETPPSGSWGELLPSAIAGHVSRLPGDPVSEALTRALRLIGQLATLGVEPGPALLPAPAIRLLVRAALDPVASEGQQPAVLDAPRALQVASQEATHGHR